MSRALKSLGLFFAFVVIYTLSRHAISQNSSASTTTTGSPVAQSTTTVPAGTSACSARDFRGVYNLGQGATGTVYASVSLTKDAGPTCDLNGWPILTLQDKTGGVLTSSTIDLPTTNSPIQFPDGPANKAPGDLRVTDGTTLRFDLAYSNVPSGSESCPSVTTVNVQFAKDGGVVTVTPTYPPQPCNNGAIWVSPFFISTATN